MRKPIRKSLEYARKSKYQLVSISARDFLFQISGRTIGILFDFGILDIWKKSYRLITYYLIYVNPSLLWQYQYFYHMVSVYFFVPRVLVINYSVFVEHFFFDILTEIALDFIEFLFTEHCFLLEFFKQQYGILNSHNKNRPKYNRSE